MTGSLCCLFCFTLIYKKDRGTLIFCLSASSHSLFKKKVLLRDPQKRLRLKEIGYWSWLRHVYAVLIIVSGYFFY